MQTDVRAFTDCIPLAVALEFWGLADMQFTITINQAKALEWQLNAQQALLFAFVYECPSWAKLTQTADGDFYALSKGKILEELPLLTDKPDTVYRLLKQLAGAGVIDLSSTASITLVRLTPKGQEWNRKLDGSEKYPTHLGKKSEVGKSSDVGEKSDPTDGARSKKNPRKVGQKSDQGRKKIRPGSEKSPTNHETSNQGTNQVTSQDLPGEADEPPREGELLPPEGSVEQPTEPVSPRREIPADMPGPKDPECKSFRTWANYAIAFRNRYGEWPVWNARIAGQITQLIDRLGAEEAPKVAAFFLNVRDARVVASCHGVGLLLERAESWRTQWATGRQITGAAARQVENTATNLSAMEQALAEQRARREADAHA